VDAAAISTQGACGTWRSLPKVSAGGVDNPLGAFAMNLGWPGYLVHGTNKPYGVWHALQFTVVLRFYPEDIVLLIQ